MLTQRQIAACFLPRWLVCEQFPCCCPGGPSEPYPCPSLTQLLQVAAAVAQAAYECGASLMEQAPADWQWYIQGRMWRPQEHRNDAARSEE